jgi:biotin carboxyl carrier protein
MKIHVKIEDTTYEVTVGDLSARPVIASVDGEDFEVWPEEMSIPGEAVEPSPLKPVSVPQAQKPMEVSTGDTKTVKAPLPGVIIELKVSEGDRVTYGQELCVLEAMKMKNTIRANREGRIRKIHISTGDQVQHSAVLMEFED